MRISFIGLLVIFIVELVVSDQQKNDVESSKKLLSTLQEMYSDLTVQIAESKGTADNTENTHLLQHYTAQRDNIENEIGLIQSIEASHIAGRHILRTLSPEEKIVPALLNIFKKPKNPTTESSNIAYSHPSYYPAYAPQYPTYPYYHQPNKPEFPYPNDLVQSTFPGYEAPPNHHQQTFTNREQFPQSYQTAEADYRPSFTNRKQLSQSYQKPIEEQGSLQVPSQYTPRPQVMLQPLVQPPQPGPYHPPFQPQSESQYQSQAASLYRPQPDESSHQLEQPQVPQLSPDLESQILQLGQQPGVFVYYPNGVDDEDEEERPTIADRFGQAFDRFGQAISSFANRQTLRSSLQRNNGPAVPKPKKSTHTVKTSRPRSSMKDSKPKLKPNKKEDEPEIEAKLEMKKEKPKRRWVSV